VRAFGIGKHDEVRSEVCMLLCLAAGGGGRHEAAILGGRKRGKSVTARVRDYFLLFVSSYVSYQTNILTSAYLRNVSLKVKTIAVKNYMQLTLKECSTHC
jgi:hypothetical protein